MKKCNHCNIEKSFEHFYKNKNIKDGYDKRCKECNKIFANRYKNKPKEIPITKKCSICNVEKSNLHFHKNVHLRMVYIIFVKNVEYHLPENTTI